MKSFTQEALENRHREQLIRVGRDPLSAAIARLTNIQELTWI